MIKSSTSVEMLVGCWCVVNFSKDNTAEREREGNSLKKRREMDFLNRVKNVSMKAAQQGDSLSLSLSLLLYPTQTSLSLSFFSLFFLFCFLFLFLFSVLWTLRIDSYSKCHDSGTGYGNYTCFCSKETTRWLSLSISTGPADIGSICQDGESKLRWGCDIISSNLFVFFV